MQEGHSLCFLRVLIKILIELYIVATNVYDSSLVHRLFCISASFLHMHRNSTSRLLESICTRFGWAWRRPGLLAVLFSGALSSSKSLRIARASLIIRSRYFESTLPVASPISNTWSTVENHKTATSQGFFPRFFAVRGVRSFISSFRSTFSNFFIKTVKFSSLASSIGTRVI